MLHVVDGFLIILRSSSPFSTSDSESSSRIFNLANMTGLNAGYIKLLNKDFRTRISKF